MKPAENTIKQLKKHMQDILLIGDISMHEKKALGAMGFPGIDTYGSRQEGRFTLIKQISLFFESEGEND